jgi:hypothetical protein
MPTSHRVVNFVSALENLRRGVDSAVVGRDPDSGLRNLIVRRKTGTPPPEFCTNRLMQKDVGWSLSTARCPLAQNRFWLNDNTLKVDKNAASVSSRHFTIVAHPGTGGYVGRHRLRQALQRGAL